MSPRKSRLKDRRHGIPLKYKILYGECRAGDTYIDTKGNLRRRPELDDGQRYWENPKGRKI